MFPLSVALQRFEPSLWLPSYRSLVTSRSIWHSSTPSPASSQTRFASNSHLSRRSPLPRPSPCNPLSLITTVRYATQDHWTGTTAATTSRQASTSDEREGSRETRNEGSLGQEPVVFLQQRFAFVLLDFFLSTGSPSTPSFRFLHRYRPALFLFRTPLRPHPHAESSRQDQETVEVVDCRYPTSSSTGIEGYRVEATRWKGKSEPVDQGIEKVKLVVSFACLLLSLLSYYTPLARSRRMGSVAKWRDIDRNERED